MSRRTLDQTLSFISAVDRATTQDAISETLLDIVRPFGFHCVLAGTIPTPGTTARQQLANIILHRWPEPWTRRYFAKGYLFDDPTVRCVTASTNPFLWSEMEGAYIGHRSARRIMNEASDFGLRTGFTVPMLTLDRQSAGLSIAGTEVELPSELRSVLQLLAIYSFARALALADEPRPQVKLTGREADVLQWIAEGKTDWEISKILNVSEHLVDKVARQIRVKFGATNRVHAVAQAMRQGIIH